MTDSPGVILAKLESIAKNQEAHGQRLTRIEELIGSIAVQSEQINTIKLEQKAQWRFIDDHTAKMSETALFQAKCPAQNTKFHLVGMWAVITLFGGIIAMVFNSVITQADKLASVAKGIVK